MWRVVHVRTVAVEDARHASRALTAVTRCGRCIGLRSPECHAKMSLSPDSEARAKSCGFNAAEQILAERPRLSSECANY